MLNSKKNLISLCLTAVFVACTVVLSRFLSINVWNMSIGFSFVSLMLCGMLCGTVWGGICAALSDFIGALLFPFGPYFFGFTATAFISGALFGVVGKFARRESKRGAFILCAAAVILFKEILCSLLLNTFWICLLYDGKFLAVLLSRIPLSAVTLVLELAFSILLRESVIPVIKKVEEKNG